MAASGQAEARRTAGGLSRRTGSQKHPKNVPSDMIREDCSRRVLQELLQVSKADLFYIIYQDSTSDWETGFINPASRSDFWSRLQDLEEDSRLANLVFVGGNALGKSRRQNTVKLQFHTAEIGDEDIQFWL